MSPVSPTQGPTTDDAAHFGSQARQRSGSSSFWGHGFAVRGRRRGAAAHFLFIPPRTLPNLGAGFSEHLVPDLLTRMTNKAEWTG